MRKKTILILLIISTIVSITYILLSYFGIIRFLMLHVYKPKSYIEKYSKLSKADDEIKTKIVFKSNEKNMKKIKPVLNSILDQTCRVDNIIILLPDKNLKLPEYISKISMVEKSEDIKNTLKKQKDANTMVLELKDDVVYGKDFIEKIVKEGKENKKNLCSKYAKLYQIDKLQSNFDLEDIIKKSKKFSYGENFKRF